MTDAANPIQQILDAEVQPDVEPGPRGPVTEMLGSYDVETSDQLLGFLLALSYDEIQLVTCDAWKQKCGGVPKNSFVIITLNEEAAGIRPGSVRRAMLLARISETATTPVAKEIQSTIFQIHKVQAKIDPLTNAELQWGALKADILGTYFDTEDGDIGFGNDVDSFLSPHFYEIYVPTAAHLEALLNSFVQAPAPESIGRLRYTETEIVRRDEVDVQVDPADFVANRTALFGKTRMGKSNTVKVILDLMLRSEANVGQLVFDLSGEYTYPDPQTGASIYLTFRDRCSRYSLNPRAIPEEAAAGAPIPNLLRANFFQQIELGHSILASVYPLRETRVPDYIQPVLSWEPIDDAQVANRLPDHGDQTRYRRARSMYFAVLSRAGFRAPPNLFVTLELRAPVKQALAALPGLQGVGAVRQNNGVDELEDRQTLQAAATIFEHLFELQRDQANAAMFPAGRNGVPYFDSVHVALLRMLGDRGITGAGKFRPFTQFHDPAGINVVQAIVDDVDAGRTVMIDLANADEAVAGYYSELISRAILSRQMDKFATDRLGDHSVLFYFEEAHNLFRSDDKDLNSIYNKLAKEGAKFKVGMVYATQSMTTLSPDLLKNTENFFIAHLNDDREVREIERRYEFRGLGLDVQRARSKGFVRMITLSHRFAIPVQIRLFTLAQDNNEAAGG